MCRNISPISFKQSASSLHLLVFIGMFWAMLTMLARIGSLTQNVVFLFTFSLFTCMINSIS